MCAHLYFDQLLVTGIGKFHSEILRKLNIYRYTLLQIWMNSNYDKLIHFFKNAS
jgi:hypothetical protein